MYGHTQCLFSPPLTIRVLRLIVDTHRTIAKRPIVARRQLQHWSTPLSRPVQPYPIKLAAHASPPSAVACLRAWCSSTWPSPVYPQRNSHSFFKYGRIYVPFYTSRCRDCASLCTRSPHFFSDDQRTCGSETERPICLAHCQRYLCW